MTPNVLQAETTAIVETDDDPANGPAVPAAAAKPGEDEILKHGFESLRTIVP